jgi:hypothetical protein
VLEEDLLVGESHPLVDLCSLLDVGGEDGLVGTELGDCLLSASHSRQMNTTRNDRGVIDQILRYHSRFPRHSVIKTGITEVIVSS